MEKEMLEDFLRSVGALNDETRVRLLKFIATFGPACVCELQKAFSMGQSRLSRHLKILKDAGFLRQKREGRWSYFYLREPMDAFRRSAIEEIMHLPIEIPKKSEGCKV